VLGAAISAGGNYGVPVTMALTSDNKTHQPFGRVEKVGEGNVNDDGNPRYSVLSSKIPAGARINIFARSWLRDYSRRGRDWWNGYEWDPHLTIYSGNESQNLLVLRNGDEVPEIDPFLDQGTVASFVDKYINSGTGRVELQPNQAIYLFELGETNVDSSAADFQDMVALVTLAQERETLQQGTTNETVAELIRVHPETGSRRPIMTLSRVYDSLATQDGNDFYATKGQKVYRLNASAMTESEIGELQNKQMPALNYGGTKLLSFEVNTDEMLPVDEEVRQSIGTPDIQMRNLGTMVIGHPDSDPHGEPDLYD